MSPGAAALLGIGGGCIIGLMISFFTVRHLIRHPRGGAIPQARRTRPVALSPGRQIADPDEAEALGLTASARKMRDKPTT